ncbi:hypothetical protein [Paracoccus aminovorans]|uniref:hypothetical protein n=1 Tax=Paracoccus aminovorans TaxID=34004 RepID=UPI001113D95A|nr:hypothetical protein [Paracoccus aminovorans]
MAGFAEGMQRSQAVLSSDRPEGWGGKGDPVRVVDLLVDTSVVDTTPKPPGPGSLLLGRASRCGAGLTHGAVEAISGARLRLARTAADRTMRAASGCGATGAASGSGASD